MNQEHILYRISQLLSRFREQIKILNSNGEFSINTHAENILIKVLNEIYECDLENVNYSENKTYPSIDLRDKPNRIAIQVTSTADLKKVKHTLTKFIEKGIYKDFDRLFIFIITEKQSKYDQSKIDETTKGKFIFKAESIIDRTNVYLELNKQNDLKKINRICTLLEEQFADNKPELDKWDLYCKGLEEYDKYITNYYNFLDIKGFSPKIHNTQVKINLEKIYVPLTLKIESEIGSTEKKEDIEILYSIEKALIHFNKIVILGDPGSGKSTILKHLAHKICSQRPTESQLSDLVPVIIKGSEFSKYVSTTSKKLSEYIIDQIDKKFEFLFTEKLESNHLLVLIDGIDEINNVSLRHSVVNRINSFIAQYPEIKVIVSSRIVGYKETRLNGYFNHLQVVEFKKEQIELFVNSWYLSIASNSDNDKEVAKRSAKELFKSIKKNDSVLKMASNPLLVTIIALIHHQGGALPEKRVSLYDIATSTFLENWVRQRETERNSSFDKETLISILAPISYHIHQNYSTGLITETELKSLFKQEYNNVYPYQSKKEESQDLKDLINFLREDAGFLFEKGLDKNGESLFGFVHQTFQEYFTSIEFKTRWKEDYYAKNLDEYVFNPNWAEVIKLSASSFKFTEQGRLGRQYSTNILKDILSVNDSIEEMYRPLKLVFQALIDDTEVEFPFFIQLIDQVFKEILSQDENHGPEYEHNREVWSFKYFIESLLETKTYQNYLVQRIVNEVNDEQTSSLLKHNLVQILINKSNIQDVKEELIKILKSDNTELKKQLFEYNTVMPVAEIVFTKEFRNSIVDYINTADYIESYSGHLPTQYHCAFEKTKKQGDLAEYIEKISSESYAEKYKEELLLSIRLIENEKIKYDYINSIVFSIGMSDLENLNEYVNSLKNEYPNLKFPKIEKYILELEEFSSYGLNEYELLNFDNIKIYNKKDEPSVFAFIKNKEVKFYPYPFNESDLNIYFNSETKSFLKFLDLILPTIIGSESVLSITKRDDLLRFIKFQKHIHWYTRLDLTEVIYYCFQMLFDKKLDYDESLLNWIKTQTEIRHRRFKISDDFNKSELISKIESSKLKIHDKLYILSLIGEKNDYEKYINPTINSMNDAESEKNKKEIKQVLYEIL
ncbi:NACHT domain-containing protein [Maribacter orientalis]|uniref:NACHT domain-containing protein n=1 Tax=Maribacter orientalis TaxID=228957 RepID=A0A1H7JQR7_9FLAO|nr:SMEK domain-containing protein [Maribacter orientalis]SEK76187.1 NACHT domain-containing protein [Maribacter orientalis]